MAKLLFDLFSASDNSPQRGLRILLVEDSPLQQKLIAHLLTQLGHTVGLASDGFEALSAVQMDGCYDVVLMDCQLPLMDGLQTTRLIREAERKTGQQLAIIGISATASADDCFAAGMDDFLNKPICKPILKSVLGRYARARAGPVNANSGANRLSSPFLLQADF